MSVERAIGLLGLVVVGLVFVLLLCVLLSVRRQRAHEQRMHEARVKALALVIGFEHTPVRGASRDRQLAGKARRRARRS